MSVGFVLLCHSALDRAAQVARHLARSGAPVVVHLDARVPARQATAFHAALADEGCVRFSARHSCEWGTWGLVAATQSAAELLLRAFPQVSHVFLASGSCLPLRHVSDLQRWLAARPDTDFIESVATGDVGWTVGGLDQERFTRHFPFSWRRNRWLFDRYVALQRKLGVTRRIPRGLVPHLGSQWWCLTRTTLQAILSDPRRPAFDRYFARTWIPDEGYFQTLARQHARRLESRSLTLAKFDFQGRPHLFYDDHLPLLRRSDCFMARKIWPGADALYQAFLSSEAPARPNADPDPGRIDRLFSLSATQRTRGRPGLWMQGRHPNPGWENGITAAPYTVFEGFADLFEEFEGWLGKAAATRVHGHLFAPDRVRFAGNEAFGPGGLSDVAALRDYNPQAFLTSLIWSARGERQCFSFGPADRQEITRTVAADPHARVWVITGAWALPLLRSGRPLADLRPLAAALQKTEGWHLGQLRAQRSRATLRVWTLAEAVTNPMEPLQTILDEISPRSPHRLAEAPQMTDLTGLGAFLHGLRNLGMPPVLTGDFSPSAPADHLPAARPRLVS